MKSDNRNGIKLNHAELVVETADNSVINIYSGEFQPLEGEDSAVIFLQAGRNN